MGCWRPPPRTMFAVRIPVFAPTLAFNKELCFCFAKLSLYTHTHRLLREERIRICVGESGCVCSAWGAEVVCADFPPGCSLFLDLTWLVVTAEFREPAREVTSLHLSCAVTFHKREKISVSSFGCKVRGSCPTAPSPGRRGGEKVGGGWPWGSWSWIPSLARGVNLV